MKRLMIMMMGLVLTHNIADLIIIARITGTVTIGMAVLWRCMAACVWALLSRR